MRFEAPWAFLILLAIPIALLVRMGVRSWPSLRFSTTDHARKLKPSLRQRLAWLPNGLRVLVLVLLAVALARPQQGKERVHEFSKGVAIEMVLDRSGSMGAEMGYAGDTLSRIEAVKRVFESFVTGKGGNLPGRPNDLIGMVAFARYAETVCPLTLAHGALISFLEHVKRVEPLRSRVDRIIGAGELLRHGIDREHGRLHFEWRDADGQRHESTLPLEDGTAIGDGLALAAARLKTAEETLARQTGKDRKDIEIQSKVIILLTDGQHNAGTRMPLEAAELAKEWDIKIYAIGIGGDENVVTIQTRFGPQKVRGRGGGVDRQTLQAVAEETGGLFRMAEDAEALRAVYEEIDRLERSEVESVRYLDYRELYGPFLYAAVGLLVLEVLLACTVFRRVP